jgi:spore coat protein U-like protein
VSVQCTAGTAFSLTLDNGIAGTGPTTRVMTKGSEAIVYGLYQDSGHGLPWGTIGVEALTGTGDAGTAVLDVYGLVPPQPTPSPGLYEDTVVATVVY